MAILSEERQIRKNGREWVMYKVMNDQSVDETTSDAIDVRNAESVCLVVESSAGVSGGVVTLESAISSDYSGTWASFGSITTSAANTVGITATDTAGGGSLPSKYYRARISTVITGGTVDVYILVQY